MGGGEDEAREEDGRVEGVEEEEDGGGGVFLEGFLEGFLVGFFEGFLVGFLVGFLGGFLETPVEVVVGIFLGPPFLGRVCAILGGCKCVMWLRVDVYSQRTEWIASYGRMYVRRYLGTL